MTTNTWHAIWAGRGPVACLLWPVSLMHGLLLAVRRLMYRFGLWQRVKLPVRVLVVGNVIVGGAGKTPVVIELARQLSARGWRVGILSRGYGRQTTDIKAVTADSLAIEVGDEPLLIHRQTGLPVVVGRDRAQAGRWLLQHHPEVNLIVCDDGLQHLGLWHDAALCVFDRRRTGNGWLLPAGPLREPWPLRSSAPHVWVLSSEDPPWAGTWPVQRTLSGSAINGNGQSVPLSQLRGPIHALAGIAQPDVFFDGLRQAGVTLTSVQQQPDHAPLLDWQPEPAGTWLCTEKDAVKLWPRHPGVWAAPLMVHLHPELLTQIEQALQ